MIARFVAFALALLPLVTAQAREFVPLSTGWRFAFQPAGPAPTGPDYDDHAWALVDLPHTWNAIDAANGGADYARGDGWYRHAFAVAPAWRGQQVFIEFGSANRVAELWLNGQRVGGHRGGYGRFRFNLTAALRVSGPNVLAVRVNNEPNDIIPLDADFNMWGGLPRYVQLIVVPATHIALLDHASPGVYLRTLALEKGHAEIEVKTLVERDGDGAALTLTTRVSDQAGRTVAERASDLATSTEATTTVLQTLGIAAPHLWQGRDDPYLYRVTIELRRGARMLDAITQPLGLRSIAVDPDRGLFLNGVHVAAHGVDWHEDWRDHGNAVSLAQRQLDFAMIKEIGATVVRLCHYEHADDDYEMADAGGLLVWAETPFVGPPPESEDGQANAVEQLRELIRQNYNHPSIFCWSVGNETKPGRGVDALLERLDRTAKAEDPDRLTTYASDHPGDDPRNFHTDLLGYNRYFGWYSRTYEEFGKWLDAWHAQHPRTPLALSEYGAGGSVFQHEQNPPPRPVSQSKGPWHPEEWQTEYHEHSWQTLQARPWVWGTFIWNMFDFAVDERHEGDSAGRNDKGLVTYDRQTRKDAFYWYKANWTEAPFVYLTSRRDCLRLAPETPVKIYSNCDAVELLLNGQSLGRKTSPDHRFVWPTVQLAAGVNRLVAIGLRGGTEVTDSCAWTLTAGSAYRPAPDPAPTARTSAP